MVFLQVSKPDLESAHKDACELRLEADRYNRQKHEMLSRAMNHQEYGAKMYYFAEVYDQLYWEFETFEVLL